MQLRCHLGENRSFTTLTQGSVALTCLLSPPELTAPAHRHVMCHHRRRPKSEKGQLPQTGTAGYCPAALCLNASVLLVLVLQSCNEPAQTTPQSLKTKPEKNTCVFRHLIKLSPSVENPFFFHLDTKARSHQTSSQGKSNFSQIVQDHGSSEGICRNNPIQYSQPDFQLSI